jgi:predicted nucleic acid-binding protein
MPFEVVLDTNVLLPYTLGDTLLRLAHRELYVMRISERILDELERNLVKKYPDRMDEAKAARYVDAIRDAFADVIVDEHSIRALEGAMTNDEGDRHVLAAAVASGAEGIVSFNRRHFPSAALQPVGRTLLGPDEFLCDLYANCTTPRCSRTSSNGRQGCATRRAAWRN